MSLGGDPRETVAGARLPPAPIQAEADAAPEPAGDEARPTGRPMIIGYRDFEPIGTGGFSRVYKAYQELYDRTVAVKVLIPDMDDKVQRRFLRECALTGRLTGHPHIVTVLDSGVTADGRSFITTDFYARGSLARLLDQQGPLDLSTTLSVGVKMAGALETAHRAGILHRDVKPQNILISAFNEPALGDFGISTMAVHRSISVSTDALTPVHAPPEVLEGDTTHPTSDIYSLASTLYCLLAGRAPFATIDPDTKREGLLVVLRRILTEPLPPLDRDDVPPQVTEVLATAMAKEAADRYPTPLALGEALQGLEQELFGRSSPLICPPPDEDWELTPTPEQLEGAREDRSRPAGLVQIELRDVTEGHDRIVVSLDQHDPDGSSRIVVDLSEGHDIGGDTTEFRPRRQRG